MRCEEFLDLIDTADSKPLKLAPEALEHSESCASCGFALRLARTLEGAPGWAEAPHLSVESRARVLARAKVERLFWRQGSRLLVESATHAFVALVFLGALVMVLPELLRNILPQAAVEFLSPRLHALAEWGHAIAAPFEPLLGQAWGLALLGAVAFFVVLAAVLSSRVLTPQWRT